MQVEDRYFEWLCKKIGADQKDVPLLFHLHNRIYEWKIPNDSNRASDGISLREEFYDETNSSGYISGPCSVLEMLVGLSVRCDRDITGSGYEERPQIIFWRMIDNLGLRYVSVSDVDKILTRWMSCRYDKTGQGGLFPLQRLGRDVRKMEIWKQLSMWIEENFDDLR